MNVIGQAKEKINYKQEGQAGYNTSYQNLGSKFHLFNLFNDLLFTQVKIFLQAPIFHAETKS